MSKGIERLECCLGCIVIGLKLGSSEVWKFGFIRCLSTVLSAKDRLGYRAPCIRKRVALMSKQMAWSHVNLGRVLDLGGRSLRLNGWSAV